MPNSIPCPVPDIDRVLSPYINSNQETAKIRKALSRYLSSNVKSAKSAPQHLDHECPHDISLVNRNQSSLKDSRLRYMHALEARLKAQTRHRDLQVSLEGLQAQHFMETPVQTELAYDSEATRGYISLLRQRRRLSELQVIQSSLEQLLGTSQVDNHKDPRQLVKEILGEQPDLPVERLEGLSNNPGSDSSMFRLKKEVLEAKASMDRATLAKANAQSNSRENFSLAQQVYALGCARDEMIAWVEVELGKLSEESVLLEDASPVKREPQEPVGVDLDSPEESIQQSYNRYTTSRSNLIKAHSSMHSLDSVGENETGSRTGAHTALVQPDTSKTTRTTADIIPHLPCLSHIGRNERSLLQQTVYLQAQLSSADDELIDSLSRLSEESHLLTSGATALVAWGETARQAETATKAFVTEQLQESHQEVNKIAAIVDLCTLQSKVLAS